MYTPAQFLWMVNDDARREAYLAAIAAVVRPGDRVLDLGAGFGFFSVAACRAGAAHVDAVDVNPIVVALGPRFAAANGCADRISFHHADGARLELPSKVDVLIGDLRGPLPLASDQLRVVASVRDRLLRPGGRMISQSDSLWVAPVNTPQTFHREVVASSADATGTDLGPVREHLRSVPYRTGVTPDEQLAAGAKWGDIDYRTNTAPGAAGSAECVVTRDGRMGGLAIWFDTVLADGIGFSNAPGTAVLAYRQLLLPLATEVPVHAGERLRFSVEALHTERGHVWRWEAVRLTDDRLLFQQNSLAETVLTSTLLGTSLDEPMPEPGWHATSLAWLISRMGRGLSQRDAAAAAQAQWPERFITLRDAERWVQFRLQELDRAERGIE